MNVESELLHHSGVVRTERLRAGNVLLILLLVIIVIVALLLLGVRGCGGGGGGSSGTATVPVPVPNDRPPPRLSDVDSISDTKSGPTIAEHEITLNGGDFFVDGKQVKGGFPGLKEQIQKNDKGETYKMGVDLIKRPDTCKKVRRLVESVGCKMN